MYFTQKEHNILDQAAGSINQLTYELIATVKYCPLKGVYENKVAKHVQKDHLNSGSLYVAHLIDNIVYKMLSQGSLTEGEGLYG